VVLNTEFPRFADERYVFRRPISLNPEQ
jgi:hypothetical protein